VQTQDADDQGQEHEDKPARHLHREESEARDVIADILCALHGEVVMSTSGPQAFEDDFLEPFEDFSHASGSHQNRDQPDQANVQMPARIHNMPGPQVLHSVEGRVECLSVQGNEQELAEDVPKLMQQKPLDLGSRLAQPMLRLVGHVRTHIRDGDMISGLDPRLAKMLGPHKKALDSHRVEGMEAVDEDELSVHSHIRQYRAFSVVIKIYGLHVHGRILTLQRGTGGVLEDDA